MPYETKLAAEIRGLGRSFEVKLTASAYAPMVHIAFDGIEADFDTDYVDHLGTDPLKLTFTTKEVTTVSALTQKMNIKCLWDV